MKITSDLIAKYSLDLYKSLPKTGKPTDKEWTVLATILLEHNENLNVVALGTGTKCLGHSELPENGIKLHDSHAEVICRRAFQRFIYNEMLAEESDIMKRLNNGRFQLDTNVKFHLYSSLMPCGDASIFPKNTPSDCGDILENDEEDAVPEKRIKLDIHRTGAKCLPSDTNAKSDATTPGTPGASYHVLGAVRTKPGRGIRTLSASCSDKLAKWLHLGMQGSLMMMLLNTPIYLASITIGNDIYSEESLSRALYKRFPKFNPKDDDVFSLHVPTLMQSSLYRFEAAKDDEKQPCPGSIIYTRNKMIEVAVEGVRQGVTKKNRNTPAGRLQICRMELFRMFLEVAKVSRLSIAPSATYGELKRSTGYYNFWQRFRLEAFKIWPDKDQSLQDFALQ